MGVAERGGLGPGRGWGRRLCEELCEEGSLRAGGGTRCFSCSLEFRSEWQSSLGRAGEGMVLPLSRWKGVAQVLKGDVFSQRAESRLSLGPVCPLTPVPARCWSSSLCLCPLGAGAPSKAARNNIRAQYSGRWSEYCLERLVWAVGGEGKSPGPWRAARRPACWA